MLAQRIDQRGKALVLRQRGRADAVQRQQTRVPLAAPVQALLRAVAQVALAVTAVLPTPGDALAQAEFFQQILHFQRIVTRQRQIVRAQRAGNAVDLAAPAVAAGLVFDFQQRQVSHPREPQRPRRRQSGHAATGNQHLRAPLHAGRWQVARFQPLAQLVAACQVDAGEAAGQHTWRIAPGQQRGGGDGGGSGRAEKLAAVHRQCTTWPHSCS